MFEERLTPFGRIEIRIDDVPISYTAVDWGDPRWPDLDGCFFIAISFEPDGKSHSITCTLKKCVQSVEGYIESGECLELQSFYKGKTKLSIGTKGEIQGMNEHSFDYYADYLEDGMMYQILPETKTKRFVFGVAWMNECDEENEYQPWMGADPTMLKD